MGTRVDFTVPGDATVTTTLRAVGALFVDNIEIDTTSAITNQTFLFNGTKFVPSFAYSPTGEPIGFQNKSDSVISFTNATRTFSISPTSASFVVWQGSSRYVKTSTETVVIPNTDGLHYIYYDAAGTLSTKTTFFTLSTEAPVAYVYWNATDSVQYFFADERHGVTLDWQTHEYLHRTRGAAYASGFDAANYTISGTGSSNANAQIDILNGVFFDEDINISINHAASPVANSWDQRLQGGAYIPAFYKSGSGVWKKDVATQYPLKTGVSPRACYNLNTAGTWTTPELSQNKYGISWIVATSNLNDPVIAILGQAEYNNQGDAEAVQWGQLDLGGFPIAEFRPLYRIIYQTSTAYANTPKTRFTGLSDLRATGGTSGGGIAITAVDHGALTGLTDDDHPQYILADGTRAFTGSITGNVTIAGNLTVNGTTTTINSTVTTIDDPILTLGGDTAPTIDDNKDRGIEFRWHNGTTAKVGFFGYDDSTGKFTFIPDATNTSEVFSGTKGTLDAYVDWADVTNKPSNLGLDAVYVNVSGDTMTGTLNTAGYAGLLSTLPAQGTVFSPFGTQSITASPFSRQWADWFRWRATSLTETSVDGVTFTTSTSTDWTHRPFIGDVTGAVTVPALDGTTLTSVRWTWASGVQFSENEWLALAVRYAASAPVVTVTWDTSPDGVTWTTQGTAASVVVTNRWTFIRFDESYASAVQHRITVERESGTVYLNSIQWLTNRPGDQGYGANKELPFASIGVGRDVTFQPTLSTVTALSVRGASGNSTGIQKWTDPSGGTIYLQVLSDGRLQSTLATGTAPFVVASTTVVTYLNADLLDGQHGSYYNDWTNVTNKPSPVITLTGDLVGNVTLTNLTNASLSATIAANSVELGTDTTGNYVATVASGETNGITVSGSGSENAAVTLFLPQALHASAAPSFARGVFTQATGTAPLTITSTTVVSHLNADLLDGQHGPYYNDWTNVTNKPSPVITLTGDVTGTATLTSLANASVVTTLSSTATPTFSRLTLTQATGTPPLSVSSTTAVTNLNADLLDGQHSTYFASQAALETVLGDLMYTGLYDAAVYEVTPAFSFTNASGIAVNYLSLPTATKPTDASLDFRVDCDRPNDATYTRRPFQWGIYFVFNNTGVFSASIRTSTGTFPGHNVSKATLDAIAAQGSRIQTRIVWDATTDTLTSYARATSTLLALTDNTGWTQVGTSTHAGVQIETGDRVPYIGFGDSNQAFDGKVYGVAGYVNASLTYNVLPTDVGNIDSVTSFTASTGQIVTVVRGGAQQTQLIIRKKPIPVWAGSNTTYRHGMYWIVANSGVIDFVDSDLSGRYDDLDPQISVANGDWIIAKNPAHDPLNPDVDLTLSQITFQVIFFSTETFVKAKINDHLADAADPHGPAGYLLRRAGLTEYTVGISQTFRSASSVATIATSTPHQFNVGDKVVVSGVGNSFDGSYTVLSVPSTTIFTYQSTSGAAASTAGPTGSTAGKADTNRFADDLFAPKIHNHNTDISAAITAHVSAADPHSIYLTATEGNSFYANINHAHSGLYELSGTMLSHLTTYDHTKFITQAIADARYLSTTATFDSRYYLKGEVDGFIAGIQKQVAATDGAQSARIYIGATQPSSATVQRGDLWIETASIALQAPVAPTNFAATAAGASVTLTWSPWPTSAALTSLTLEYALNSSFTSASALPASPATITTYTHSGLTENTLYYYRLRATNSVGTGTNASTSITSANVAPPTPTISASAVAGTANITATFSAAAYSDAPANRYIMYLNNAAVAAVASSPYTFTGLTEGVSYTVGVQTVDTGGLTSAIVNASPVTTNNLVPPAPASATATVVNSNQVQVSWPVVSITDFQTYRVQLFLSSNLSASVATQDTTNLTHTFTGLNYVTSYTAKVFTIDSVNNISTAAQSASVTTTTQQDTTPPVEATIVSFKPETSYGNMVLRGNWPSDADFTSGTVERSTDNTNWTTNQTFTSQTPGASFSSTISGGPYAAGTTVYARVKVTDTNGNTRTGTTQSYTLITSPTFISADATNSWRNTNGGQYNANGNFRPYQGYFSNATWNAYGLWYYGTKPYSDLYNSGRRTITALRFLIVRWDAGSSTAMSPVFVLHKETTSPGTVTGIAAPATFGTEDVSTATVGTVATGTNVAWETLSTQWGIDIASGTYKGIAVYDATSPVYANFASITDNNLTGTLEFTHLG